MKRVLVLALSLNLIFINPASALFGLECRNPKAALKKVNTDLVKEKKLVKSYEAEKSSLMRFRTNGERQEGYRNCLSSKTLPKISKIDCKWMWIEGLQYPMCFDERCEDLLELTSALSRKIEILETKRDLIIIQNSKCFDAGLVADSQMRQNR
jgi:hypothetical protein